MNPWVVLVWFDNKYREAKRFDTFGEAEQYADKYLVGDAVAFYCDHSKDPAFEGASNG